MRLIPPGRYIIHPESLVNAVMAVLITHDDAKKGGPASGNRTLSYRGRRETRKLRGIMEKLWSFTETIMVAHSSLFDVIQPGFINDVAGGVSIGQCPTRAQSTLQRCTRTGWEQHHREFRSHRDGPTQHWVPRKAMKSYAVSLDRREHSQTAPPSLPQIRRWLHVENPLPGPV